MGKKDNKIRELEEQKAELEYDVAFLEERITLLNSQKLIPIVPIKRKHCSKLRRWFGRI